jgi:hypothetical protein
MATINGEIETPKGVIIKPEEYLQDVLSGERSEIMYSKSTYFITGQIIEVVEKHILSKFPVGYFKFVHKATRCYNRLEQIRFPSTVLKQRKPILALAPSLMSPSESKMLFQNFMYQGDTNNMEDIMGDTIMSNEDLNDKYKNIKVVMIPRDLGLNMTAVFVFNSRGIAYDATSILENCFTSMRNTYITANIEIPLPDECVSNIGERFGLELDDKDKLTDPDAFVETCSKYFNAPISCILDTSMQRKRICMTVDIDIMLSCGDLPEFSDVNNKASTGMRVDIKLNTIQPSYYVIKTNRQSIVRPQVTDNIINSEKKITWVTEVDESGRALIFETDPIFEKANETASFGLYDILDSEIVDFLTWVDESAYNRTDAINIQYYKNSEENTSDTFTIDYNTVSIEETNGDPESQYWIGIYLNRTLYHEYTRAITKADDTIYKITGRE